MTSLNAIIALAAGSIGFVIRSAWDVWSSRREKTRVMRITQRIDNLDKSLQKFYWPLYIMICKDIIVSRRKNYDKDTRIKIEETVIVPNYKKMLKLLQKYTHLAEPDADFQEQILLFIKYASLYTSIRKGCDYKRSPKNYGATFPIKFIEYVEKYTNNLQAEYNTLLGLKYDKNNFGNKKIYNLLGRKYHAIKNKPSFLNKLWCCGKKSNTRSIELPQQLPNTNYYTSAKLCPEKIGVHSLKN